MADARFPSPGVDARFPEPGIDARFPGPVGYDARFYAPGEDGRFNGNGYGGGGGSPFPLIAEGVSGNRVCYPQYSIGKGPNASLYAVNLILVNGSHVIRLYSLTTNELVDEQVIRSNITYDDDHNTPGGSWLSDGTYVAAATGHGTNSDVVIATRSPSGTWSFETITYSDVLTYPNLLADNNDKLWLFIRRGGGNWQVRTKTGAGAWTAPETFQTSTEQTYAAPIFYDPANHRFIFCPRPNSISANFGKIKLVTLDAATGEFVDGNGGLGFIGGGASSNAKVLPWNVDDVSTFHTPSAGNRRNVVDISPNADALAVNTRQDADSTYVGVAVWKYGGLGSFFDIANWVLSPVIETQGNVVSVESNYAPGVAFLPTDAGYRIAVTKIEGSDYAIYQFDNTSGDVLDWSKAELARVDTGLLWRPFAMLGGGANAPVMLSQMASFIDYNAFTDPKVRFAAPWNGARQLRPETQAWIARMQVAPPTAWADIYDALVTRLIARSLWAKLNCFYPMLMHDVQASLLNAVGSSYTLTQGDGLPSSAFTAKLGWTGDGVGYLETGFDPTVDTSRYVRNSAHIMVQSHTSAQDPSAEIGVLGALIIARSATDNLACRVNQSTSDNVTSTFDGFGRVILSRENSTTLRRFKEGANQGSTTTASAAPVAGDTFRLLTRFGTTARSQRRISQASIGSGLTVTEIGYLNSIMEQFEADVGLV